MKRTTRLGALLPVLLYGVLLRPSNAAGELILLASEQANSASTNDPAALFRLGKQAMQTGQLTIAEEDFRRVIALDPKSGAAHVNLGVTYMRLKRWDDALSEFRRAEELSPGQPGIELNIGLAYYRRNDFASAIEPFSHALERMPDPSQARYLLGLCYFFTNKYKEATDTLAPLWEKESANLNYLYVLSIAASKSSNAALQQQAFERMLAIGQNTPEFHLYIGKAWLAEDDTDKALNEFKQAASMRPDLPLVHYFLGRTYLEQHAFSQAEAELRKDIAIEPDFAYTYEDLGIMFAQLDQPAKAEQAFLQAIERNSSLVNSYFGLAKLYRGQGRYSQALEMLDHAIPLAPQSASLHYTRGQVLAHLGQTAKAHAEFDTSAKLLKSFNDRLQLDPSGDRSADAQDAAQQ
ncbi:TPR domain protein, putative component of TonB system [Acidisarcina polymorpha]|uniref:TPR domain protein, putative component of TonB system n=1 Tax=Acidisarcina polymorpha TaxID=2211140 RepID=A0A2Z5G6I2_9BACT|nr:tetratricopeptide repeat protein [Acidisarcina polymorpha]AXC14156.1 TPR domain protein, putative component of TonB system [Acidisarcina polymorpha]